ncbi:MAG: YHS domain-containing (seleno)protein [Fulvivirga sp.]
MKNIFTVCLCIVGSSLYGQEFLKHANEKKGVFIAGYDVVSYFNGNPQKGSDTFQYMHEGLTYWFVNSENKETFVQNPDDYIPKYGGWCAYAMGETGEKVKIDPETYKIIGNELYLFYNFGKNNTLTYWNSNEQNLKPNADKNWIKILNNQ